MIAPHLDNATLYSFNKFIRKTIGSNNIDYRTDYRMLPVDTDNNYSRLAGQPFRIADIDNSDVIVVFGSDLIREHANEYLRLRKAYNFHGADIYSLTPHGVKSADIARLELIYRPGTEELAVNAVCLAAIEEGLVPNQVAEALKGKLGAASLTESARLCGLDESDLRVLARALSEAGKVTFIAGELVTRSRERELIATALCNLGQLFGINDKGQMAILARYANSTGAARLGLLPEPHPRVRRELEAMWGPLADAAPCTTDKMIANMKKEELDGFFIIGANPAMIYPDRLFAREGLEKLDFLVACDMFETETTALADVVLPLASWAEYDGNYVNLEGRLQTAQAALKPPGESLPGYEIVAMMADALGKKLFESATERDEEMRRLLALDGVISLPTDFAEVKPVTEETREEFPLALYICDDAHHSGHLTEKAASLVNFQSEAYLEMSADLAARHHLAEGGSVRVESEVGKIIVPARISEHIENDVLVMPRNFTASPVTSLLMRKRRIDRVRISKVAD
jgi:predicted molibdopterin-dependent oxidoreductase YjgC